MMKSAAAVCASLLLASIAIVHCGGDDSSTPSTGSSGSGGSAGTSTGSSGSTTSSTTSATGGSGTAGSGGSAGTTTGTGGFGGTFDLDAALAECPTARPKEGTACPGPVAICPYGASVICGCTSDQPWLCVDLNDLADAGFTFDSGLRFDAGR